MVPQFWKNERTPKKQLIWRDKIFLDPEKNFPARNWVCHVLFAKKNEKIRQVWPQQLLKHSTAGYREFPPCTPSLSILSTERRGTAMY